MSEADRSNGLRTALRWLPTFAGFPLGGYIAEQVVGRVDSPLPAVVGGALSGVVLGSAQWFALRPTFPTPAHWIASTAVGFATGLGLGAAVVGYRTDTSSLALQGAVCGFAIGLLQAPLLRRHLGRLALAWPVALAGLWALGWTITASIGVDVEAQYTVFGSSGALAVTVLTSVLPVLLSRRAGRSNRGRVRAGRGGWPSS